MDGIDESLTTTFRWLLFGAVLAVVVVLVLTAALVSVSPRAASPRSWVSAGVVVVCLAVVAIVAQRAATGDMTGYDALWGIGCLTVGAASAWWLLRPRDRGPSSSTPNDAAADSSI